MMWMTVHQLPALRSETPQGRVQLRQAVHPGEDRADAHGQALHDEPRPDRIHGLLVPQPGVRPTRLNAGSTNLVLSLLYKLPTSPSIIIGMVSSLYFNHYLFFLSQCLIRLFFFGLLAWVTVDCPYLNYS